MEGVVQVVDVVRDPVVEGSVLPRRLLDIPRPGYVAAKWWNVGAARPARLRARVIDDETGMWVSEEVERELAGEHVHVIMEPCCAFLNIMLGPAKVVLCKVLLEFRPRDIYIAVHQK